MKKGAYTLLITPFKEDYSLDEEALRTIVRMQVESDITGIAPLGVTGENPLLSDGEVKRVIEIIVEEAKGKKDILPDLCLMGTPESLMRAQMYADLGADYVVAFTPYFIMPSPEGLMKYYEQLAEASPIPIVLHSSKGRTGVELTPAMTAQLAKHPNIVATKDGKKELDHLAKLIYLTKNDDFLVFTGKDTTAFPTVAFGGAGSFTVAGNVIPDVMGKMMNYALEGKLDEANKMHLQYYRLFEACRFETNPMAAKRALELMGKINATLRPPMTELSDAKTQELKTILTENGLI
ncbi:MAG: 4-hydroxy-tetrahydrodipicolinate synthase [Bacteroidales bacterium]|nr:4-hydroxy-tetrahydrodipicolinate synthase [Bacteroidales bacterium]MCF8352180.1 4-hydroxy-tetrahydrodipicolinate synthase [Bacteroidales bacterium]MCF8377840.1 4-hydroxy-tetrahydrodipicolinate synthase [Bacteroidales bacterium]MCF8402200.1 4-hydroxy-tetrahydrodipicolinate synthase [Bacteroidales bacterium]